MKTTFFKGVEYIICGGLFYPKQAPSGVVTALDYARRSETRIQVFYGDPQTGKHWNEERETTGYVAPAKGARPLPILVFSKRTSGGPFVMCENVLKIVVNSGRRVLYEAPTWRDQVFTTRTCRFVGDDGRLLTTEVLIDGQVEARFESSAAAARYIARMSGNTSPQRLTA